MLPTPFNLFSTIVFAFAIIHTFLTPTLYSWSLRLKRQKKKEKKWWKFYHFSSEILFLLSEVEVVFGIWLIPLLVGYMAFYNKAAVVEYLNSRDYTQALYMMVIVVIIASKPIIEFAEKFLEWIAKAGGDSAATWWWTIMTIGPLLSVVLKEPGAMALSAILLTKKFYPYHPSKKFKYATLGLLFANVSISGMLTTFSSRSLYLAAEKWRWTTPFMIQEFGWKTIIAILVSNMLYFICFRKEFDSFPKKMSVKISSKNSSSTPPPLWITIVHIFFVTMVAITGDNAPFFIGIFILFLGFHRATSFYQHPLQLKMGMLVGFFFASLIVHAELQGWWVKDLLIPLSNMGKMFASFILSGFIDNAAVIYLAAEIPTLDRFEHYAIVVGAMAAGGLSVIANAPNPIGHSILRGSFTGKISFFFLCLSALIPSAIIMAIFWFLKDV